MIVSILKILSSVLKQSNSIKFYFFNPHFFHFSVDSHCNNEPITEYICESSDVSLLNVALIHHFLQKVWVTFGITFEAFSLGSSFNYYCLYRPFAVVDNGGHFLFESFEFVLCEEIGKNHKIILLWNGCELGNQGEL